MTPAQKAAVALMARTLAERGGLVLWRAGRARRHYYRYGDPRDVVVHLSSRMAVGLMRAGVIVSNLDPENLRGDYLLTDRGRDLVASAWEASS